MLKLLSLLFSILLFSFCSHSQNIGTKVSFTAADGKQYSGVIKEIQNEKFLVKYDGFQFEAWLTIDQFKIADKLNEADNKLLVNNQTTTSNYSDREVDQNINAIFNFGRSKGWSSLIQENILRSYLSQLTIDNKNKLLQILNKAITPSAKFFALKSFAAGDDYAIVQKFIEELNQYPEDYQVRKCLVTERQSIIQQWQYSCSVTSVQTFLGDLCPRYAWEVKRIKNFDIIANDPSHPMAQQQKLMLESYGGGASARGDYSGKAIGILGPLNDYVGKLLGVSFYAQQITEPLPLVLGKIRTQLDRGINVPLLIGFPGTDSKHFILVMKYKQTNKGYQYLIYDPWDGLCDYVTQDNLERGSIAPLNNAWRITVDYYYPTSN